MVCEADSDRVIYSSVSSALTQNQEILFIHAHNKQTVHIVLGLLTQANIPCCAIIDIDILNGKDDLDKVLHSLSNSSLDEESLAVVDKLSESIGNIGEEEALNSVIENVSEFLGQLKNGEHTFNGARGALNRLRKDATKWGALKSQGISVLDGDIRPDVESLLKTLKGLGVFVVPVGELEGWIDLGDKKKNKWIVPALEHLANKGAPDNLVGFIEDVMKYINDL